jgi:hypothetical protein
MAAGSGRVGSRRVERLSSKCSGSARFGGRIGWGGEDTEEVAAWFPGGGLGLAGEDGRPPPPAAAAYDTVCRKQPFRHLLLSLSTRRVVKNLSNLELLVLPPCVTV